MTPFSWRQCVGTTCSCTRSVNTIKKEKREDSENLLDEIPCGGLSQLLGIGGIHTPSLSRSLLTFLLKYINPIGPSLAYIYKLPFMDMGGVSTRDKFWIGTYNNGLKGRGIGWRYLGLMTSRWVTTGTGRIEQQRPMISRRKRRGED